jgi:predicted GNAT superfamily acetyltransferase
MPRFNRMKNLSVSGSAASGPATASDRFHTAFGFLQISPRFGPLAFA